jgi:hypothetical protein
VRPHIQRNIGYIRGISKMLGQTASSARQNKEKLSYKLMSGNKWF